MPNSSFYVLLGFSHFYLEENNLVLTLSYNWFSLTWTTVHISVFEILAAVDWLFINWTVHGFEHYWWWWYHMHFVESLYRRDVHCLDRVQWNYVLNRLIVIDVWKLSYSRVD